MELNFDSIINEAMARAQGRAVEDPVQVFFMREPELDERKSQKEGRPCYRKSVFAHFRIPGQGRKRYRVNDKMKAQYTKEWQWFLRNDKQEIHGHPIEEWNQIPSTRAVELKAAGILSVEQLAAWDLEDRPLDSGSAALVILARDFVQGVDEKDKQIAALSDERDALLARVVELEAAKPKRGRPPKQSTSESEGLADELVNDVPECG